MKTARHLNRWLVGAAAALSLALAIPASAQSSYPNKPITFVVPFGTGTTDRLARFAGEQVSKEAGQPVIVDSKAGADGIIGILHTLKQPADGYTMVVGTITTHAANTSLHKELPYDPMKDFVPVAGLAEGGLVLVVRPDFEANSIQELIALAKKNRDKYSFGSPNSTGRFGGERFQQLAGVNLLHVPYKSAAAALTDLIGGQTDMVFADMPAGMPLVQAGRLKALAVSTKERVPALKDIPTFAEQGLPDYSYIGWVAVFAKQGTPKDVVNKMNKWIVDAMETPAAKELLHPLGWSSMKGTPEELLEVQARDTKIWADLVESAGIERR